MPKLKKKKKAPTLSSLKKKAWAKLSQLVRIEHADPSGDCSCYTCGKTEYWSYLQAGHAIGGRNMAVLFDESIIRPQCVRCNIMLSGNYGRFAARLIKENGIYWYEGKLAGATETVKESRVDMQERIDEYDLRISNHPHAFLLRKS